MKILTTNIWSKLFCTFIRTSTVIKFEVQPKLIKMNSFRTLFFLIQLIFVPFFLQAQLNKTEKEIIKSVDDHTEESLELLTRAVNINSGTMNFEGVREVARLFKEELDELGFETEITSGESFGRAGHLVATHEGKPGIKLLLIGHLDTVFELDSPFQSSGMVNDSIMKAPGVADMKGGDVVIILAMRALKDAGVLDDRNDG